MLIEDEGRNYTAAEYEQQLTETGFRQPRRVSLNVPGANGLITSGLSVRGTPPGA
jgi:hypothetical protein